MKNRTFVLAIVLICALLASWYIYVSQQASQARSVQSISVDWWASAHADASAEAFTHWNEDDPPVVPVNCAKCHSGQGFLNYLGQDSSAVQAVDAPAAINSVITCEVCHNEKADALQLAELPSGINIEMGSGNALCASCHSGTNAGVQVALAAQGYGDDEIIPDAAFINPHYAFAAATWLGSEGQGGYHYPASSYTNRFEHAKGVNSCTACHEPHSLRMRKDYENADLCAACHSNVVSYSDYRDVWVGGVDFDGDGVVKGIYHEIEGMRQFLMDAIQQYAIAQLDQPIGWADQYPYLFVDSDSDGAISAEEAVFPNRYLTFTPRLLRTTFNYQFSAKDPAGYVHNGKYMLQLLYDSIQDIAQIVEINTSSLVRPE